MSQPAAAIVPVNLVPVDMNAFQVGEPNFMRPIADLIRRGEAGNTAAKVATYVLSRLFAILVSLIPGLGAYLVGKTIAEYTRQNNQVAVSTNAPLRQLNGDAIQANLNMTAMRHRIDAQAETIRQQANTMADLQQQAFTLQNQNHILNQSKKELGDAAQNVTRQLEESLSKTRQENEDLLARLKSEQPAVRFNYSSLTTPIAS